MIIESLGACNTNMCPEIIAPVCVDGQTFNNACKAEAAGYSAFVEGACDSRACTQTYAPVCGENSMTYLNACIAERSGTRIQYAGLCAEQGTACEEIYMPVCGIDQRTYDNKCHLDNAGVELAYAGVCFGQSR